MRDTACAEEAHTGLAMGRGWMFLYTHSMQDSAERTEDRAVLKVSDTYHSHAHTHVKKLNVGS